MHRWLKLNSILKNRKAEFFIISAVIMASILISIQGLFGGYSDVDFTEVIKSRETYIFNSIKNEIKEISGNDCDDLRMKLVEFRDMTENQVKERGYDFNIQLGDCNATGHIYVNMTLVSSDYDIGDDFITNP
ncbi:MAG: hypothetical protein ABEK17_04245 [Candidatus Aenigmatarchaeota archaeon]